MCSNYSHIIYHMTLHIMFGKLNQYLSQDVCKPVLLSLNIVHCIVRCPQEVGKGEMAALTLTPHISGSTSLINTHVLFIAQAASPDPCRGSNRITSAVMTGVTVSGVRGSSFCLSCHMTRLLLCCAGAGVAKQNSKLSQRTGRHSVQ